ncbi:MAG: hypothetical protein QM572_02150 [Nocardioides sp.]|uniref:hypothetical protein n=1 Tax=Nocardioides sp. TaxID=35761 RepID=UPI0039E46260
MAARIAQALTALEDGRVDDLPTLVRGEVRIIPLGWLAASEGDDARPRFTALWTEARDAFTARAGWGRSVQLDGEAPGPSGYAGSLAESGAYRADWWGLGRVPEESAVVLVCALDPEGSRSVCLQVVPIDWLRWRPASKRKRPTTVPETDLRWTWADVVRLYESREDTTDQGSDQGSDR